MLFFTACNEDEDSESVSSSGTPITCEMILKELEVKVLMPLT